MSVERLFAAGLAAGGVLAIFAMLRTTRLGRLRLPRLPRLPRATGLLWPALVSLALILFGAIGLAVRGAGVGPSPAVGLAAVAAAGVVLLLGLTLGPALRRSEQAGLARSSSLLGVMGRVSLAVPSGGTGQVTCQVGGRAVRMPARSQDGAAVGRDTAVMVTDIVGHVAVVETL